MNPYDNKNEYEILDASPNQSNMSNTYPKYPLANNPEASMKNTNYKDWLAMCNQNEQLIGDISMYSSPEAYVSVRGSIGFGVGLLSTILVVLGGPISVLLGAIIGITTAVLEFIPSKKDAQGKYLEIWNTLIDSIKVLINDVIDTYALDHARSNLDGLYAAMNNYENKLKVWKSGNNGPVEQSEIQRVFADTHQSFLTSIPSLQQLGHQQSFLPLFAIAANLHLLLLRDVSVYGKEWGYTDNIIKGYYQDQLKGTKEYTDYAVRIYKEGLEKAKRIPGSSNLNWDNYNQYRREMTVTVLDIISLFPTYDTHQYNMSTKIELTREVYTDRIGSYTTVNTAKFNEIENGLTREPHLFTWLKTLKFFETSPFRSGYDIITAMQNEYQYTKGNSPIMGPILGWNYTNRTPTIIPILAENDIFNVYSRYYGSAPIENPDSGNFSGVASHTLYFSEGSVNRIGGAQVEAGVIYSNIPDEYGDNPTLENYTHRLSYISALAATCGSHGCRVTPHLCAFTHTSVDRHNMIYTDKITQIPAVKAFDISDTGAGKVIAGPGHTGGDLIQLPNNARLKIRLTPTSTSNNYRVRVRYSSTELGTLRAERWSPSSIVSNNFTYLSTGSLDTFGYLETLTTTFNQSGVEIIIQNLSSTLLIIDKIEFIPVGTLANQSLEKVVNDLFIN
ncbi:MULTISPECIES: insecticidal delta-endotoxin Cry8Ea1 family protein [Bacillus cereus group]|uniref:insecticidal delta-endotoxin Cry8Ea1 family protein n=1 Tax=Bacillus cereus group TaxID=86661 RepID=UPI0021D37746|nr:insecticidal delta-endotoxin Cry8Ea1 family protein [Bacillus wiedmannii]MCU5600785.1 insecticidal delta-endotoxin Cry8Ea1 family protein [Bacillus wiedmannii]